MYLRETIRAAFFLSHALQNPEPFSRKCCKCGSDSVRPALGDVDEDGGGDGKTPIAAVALSPLFGKGSFFCFKGLTPATSKDARAGWKREIILILLVVVLAATDADGGDFLIVLALSSSLLLLA